jgi:TusA-related sulfurtransferase
VTTEIPVDEIVDARNLMCPMPILAATKVMKRLAPNNVIKVLATDKGSLSDIPAWVDDTGNELLYTGTEDGGVLVFVIRKTAS